MPSTFNFFNEIKILVFENNSIQQNQSVTLFALSNFTDEKQSDSAYLNKIDISDSI